ncbi:uncharacterized protein B0I36DRAFT_351683 [Microdochium trichocladiopsis]|uniref:DUF7357 domain-containing protein n=1 Tax=Microdochium trichocladiopsis TaxID=1682393 RepID=A0A9P9BJL7_9PEZI|nr:uncharacterized protein B0I36DRAFT_351683 [Microdochium trichocladiopsis]KAH7025704.1 hypothetical protein B0I36DRAFT_351683 [Microdochium trichocladiopsis]
MADTTMRLRVVVQRNGLPETRYMLPVPLEGNPTIAKLLELVNSCTPIESDEWGLEDYAVELPAPDGTRNECFHFQSVREVLKEDEQVFIRPLQTDDLRRRRISGRYQISSDGKHLVDGVAFGRPLLRGAPSRPGIFIPPRKRRRLLNSSEEENSYQNTESMQLLLTNGEDATHDPDFEQVADGMNADFSPSGSDSDVDSGDSDYEADEDLADEVEALQRENTEIDDGVMDMGVDAQLPRQRPDSRRSQAAPQEITLEALDNMGALRAAFPAAPIDLCERVLAANHNDLKLAYINLKEAFDPALPESAVLSGKLFNTHTRGAPEGQGSSTTAARQGAPQGNDDAMEDENDSGSGSDDDVPDLVKRYDRCGLPPGSISSGHGLASMAAITGVSTGGDSQATSTTLRPTKIVFADEDEAADTTSSSESSSSSESEDSSEDDNDNDDDDDDDDSDSSDSQDGGNGSWTLPQPRDPMLDSDSDDSSFDGDDDSDDDSSADSSEGDEAGSDDDSDSGPEEMTAKEVVPVITQKPAVGDTSSESESSDSSSSDSDSSSDDSSSGDKAPTAPAQTRSQPVVAKQAQPTVAPGQGKACTKSRNARRRAAKKAQKEQQQSGVGQDGEAPEAIGDPTLQTFDEKAAFEAKRQALLDALANGGIEVGPGGSTNLGQANPPVPSSKRKRDEEPVLSERQQQDSMDIVDNDTPPPAATQPTSPESQQKRQRFDLAAGKRLLFGALGLRAPKTADDAEKVRSQLMKDVRPLVNARLEADKAKKEMELSKSHDAEDEDPDAWREKINYRAVECCQEGIVLSEPPFPFVQRWDPQQQGLWNGKKNKRGGKGKKADRNQGQPGGKKRRHDDSLQDESFYDDTSFNGVAGALDDDAMLDYDDPVPDEAKNSGEGDASQFTDIEDLPSLPKDPSTLPSLQAQDAKVGMVITWKKWSCSAATKWQPLISDVTAVVIRVENEGSTLEVCLAKRDRHLDRAAKRYDEVTGQRLYDKFEAPDINDDEDENEALEDEQDDDGFRALDFTELLEPRVVQQAADDKASTQPEAAQTNGNSHSDPAIGLIPSIEQSSGQVPGLSGPSASSMVMAADGGNERDVAVNTGVPEQSGKSSMPLSGNSSSDPATAQAGQGHPTSQIESGLLREPSPSEQHSTSISDVRQPKEPAPLSQPLEDPSRYEGDLDAQMVDKPDHVVHETQPDTDSSAHTPMPFHDAMSNASAPLSNTHDDDTPLFHGIEDDEDDVIAGTPPGTRPRLREPTPMSSVASGRQPDPITAHDVLEPDTYKVLSTSDVAAVIFNSQSDDDGDGGYSDGPFARHNDATKQPLEQPSQAGQDAEYEAVIRELDGSPEPSPADGDAPLSRSHSAYSESRQP